MHWENTMKVLEVFWDFLGLWLGHYICKREKADDSFSLCWKRIWNGIYLADKLSHGENVRSDNVTKHYWQMSLFVMTSASNMQFLKQIDKLCVWIVAAIGSGSGQCNVVVTFGDNMEVMLRAMSGMLTIRLGWQPLRWRNCWHWIDILSSISTGLTDSLWEVALHCEVDREASSSLFM